MWLTPRLLAGVPMPTPAPFSLALSHLLLLFILPLFKKKGVRHSSTWRDTRQRKGGARIKRERGSEEGKEGASFSGVEGERRTGRRGSEKHPARNSQLLRPQR